MVQNKKSAKNPTSTPKHTRAAHTVDRAAHPGRRHAADAPISPHLIDDKNTSNYIHFG
jgi:hypothetical protein